MSFCLWLVGNGSGEAPLDELVNDERFHSRVEKDLSIFVDGIEKILPQTDKVRHVKEEIRKILNSGRGVMTQADDQAIFILSSIE